MSLEELQRQLQIGIPPVPPALALAILVGAIHTCVYVLVRGQLRFHVLLVLPAAMAGAWAGQALGARLGDPLRLGDFSLSWASLLAWVGILAISVAATLGARSPHQEEPVDAPIVPILPGTQPLTGGPGGPATPGPGDDR